MACMCGDICCWSCGPAQGNTKCPICRAWASDGCEHFHPDTGELLPEFEAQLAAVAEAERIAEDRAAKEWEEECRLAEEYWVARARNGG